MTRQLTIYANLVNSVYSPPMKSPVAEPSDKTDRSRRTALLESALGVFLRFGYRKTSMDEVAQAAQISRQGLYLHFATKEELFRATVQHAFESCTTDGLKALAREELPLEERLVGAFDQCMGRYVGSMTGDAVDLIAAAEPIIGKLMADHHDPFLNAVAAVIRDSGLAAAYKPAGITAHQIAETLDAAADGLKEHSPNREEFVRGLNVAVRVICAPLALGR